jgi:4-hydroxy-2-oxoheptanedioate aldolase
MQNVKICKGLADGQFFNGIWRTLPDEAVTEIVAQAGYDFQIFDLEHAALSWSDIQRLVRINNALGRASFVRLGDRSAISAQRALDAGAHGLVYPGVNSIEDVTVLAENFSFAPDGRRGFNPFVPAFGYGLQKVSDGSRPVFMSIVETRAGLLALDAIASHPAVDIVYLGAYDLSVQLGTPGDIASAIVQDALKDAVAICRKHACAVGLMVGTVEDIKKWSQLGVQVLLHGVDAGIIRKALELKKT